MVRYPACNSEEVYVTWSDILHVTVRKPSSNMVGDPVIVKK